MVHYLSSFSKSFNEFYLNAILKPLQIGPPLNRWVEYCHQNSNDAARDRTRYCIQHTSAQADAIPVIFVC